MRNGGLGTDGYIFLLTVTWVSGITVLPNYISKKFKGDNCPAAP